MPNNPLHLVLKLVFDLLLLSVQIIWQCVLISYALIPCAALLHPALPCKTKPWNSPTCHHRCLCPSLPPMTCLRSAFYGPATSTRPRSRQTCRRRRTRAAQPRPCRTPRLCPQDLAARLQTHLTTDQPVPRSDRGDTPPPPYDTLASQHPQGGNGAKRAPAPTSQAGRCAPSSSSDPHCPTRASTPPLPAPPCPPSRRRRRTASSTPTAPPPLTDTSDSE